MNNIIQSLWIGDRLSIMERLSIKSFLDYGHDFHLYHYNEIENVPEGTTLVDANEILPEEDVFSYKVGPGKGSYSAFSNYFRYKLLNLRGGWWVDTDVICLKYFDFDSDYVFSSELTHDGELHTASCVIKAPVDNTLTNYCYQICTEMDKDELDWGTVGPKLVKGAVEFFNYESYVQDYHVFCPVGYAQANIFMMPNTNIEFPESSYAVHLWNEMWRRYNMEKDGSYHETSIYEKLKSKHGISNDN